MEGLVFISQLLILLITFTSGHEYYDISDPGNHPLIRAAEESTVTCPENIDPNAHWMKQFLHMIDGKLPIQAVSFDDLLPNLKHLALLEDRGWLKAIATGEKKADEINWPIPKLKPLIIPMYMPLVTPPQPEPVIVLEQIYNGEKIFKELIGHPTRKRRDVNGEEMEELEQPKQRAYHVESSHFNDESIPQVGVRTEEEIHEPEFDDDGQIIGRKKREIPENMVVWPPTGTYFIAKRLCVKAYENGTIIFPDD